MPTRVTDDTWLAERVAATRAANVKTKVEKIESEAADAEAGAKDRRIAILLK